MSHPPAPPPGYGYNGQGFGDQGYGYGPGGHGYGQPPAPVKRPGSVDAAFGVMLLVALLSLVGLIVTLTHRDEIKRKILERTPTASQGLLDGALTFSIGFTLVFLVLYLALAFTVRAGKNWARIVTWVLAGLGVVALLGTLAQPTVGANRALGIVSGLLDIALIVLLALAPSNAYFRRQRRPGY